jgi:hypothetical protein
MSESAHLSYEGVGLKKKLNGTHELFQIHPLEGGSNARLERCGAGRRKEGGNGVRVVNHFSQLVHRLKIESSQDGSLSMGGGGHIGAKLVNGRVSGEGLEGVGAHVLLQLPQNSALISV